MNYQPGFSHGASAAPLAPPLDGLAWLMLEPRAILSDAHRDRREAFSPLLALRSLDDARTLPEEGAAEPRDENDRADAPSGNHDGNAMDPSPEQPRRRVPDGDIVDVGPCGVPIWRGKAISMSPSLWAQAISRTPPTNAKGPMARRSFARPLLALLVLEFAVLGGIYVKKRYADSQVIVVPAPLHHGRSVIT